MAEALPSFLDNEISSEIPKDTKKRRERVFWEMGRQGTLSRRKLSYTVYSNMITYY